MSPKHILWASSKTVSWRTMPIEGPVVVYSFGIKSHVLLPKTTQTIYRRLLIGFAFKREVILIETFERETCDLAFSF